MKVETILICVLLFSAVLQIFMGSAVYLSAKYSDMGYSRSIDTSQTDMFDKAEEINNQTTKMQQMLTSSHSNLFSTVNAFLYSGWSALLNTISLIPIVSTMILGIANILNVPPVIVSFLIGSLTLTIIFTLIYIAFRVGSYD